jgi:hypothetical protein
LRLLTVRRLLLVILGLSGLNILCLGNLLGRRLLLLGLAALVI